MTTSWWKLTHTKGRLCAVIIQGTIMKWVGRQRELSTATGKIRTLLWMQKTLNLLYYQHQISTRFNFKANEVQNNVKLWYLKQWIFFQNALRIIQFNSGMTCFSITLHCMIFMNGFFEALWPHHIFKLCFNHNVLLK